MKLKILLVSSLEVDFTTNFFLNVQFTNSILAFGFTILIVTLS